MPNNPAAQPLATRHSPLATPTTPRPLFAAWMLAWREVVRFLRQRNRVVGAIGQPIVFWLLFSAGLSQTFSVPGQSFAQYYFPGTLLLIVLFTAIFATISVIEDRKEGFLQAVLVAPLPRWSLVAGKVFGAAAIALAQGLLFLVLAVTIKVYLPVASWLLLALFLLIVSVGLTSLGFILAWRLDSTQGFHAIMSLLLMPMWLLSGAFFPVPGVSAASAWSQMALHWIMRLNPVTYGVAGVRWLMLPGYSAEQAQAIERGASTFWMPSPAASWGVSLTFAVVMFLLAWKTATRTTSGDLL